MLDGLLDTQPERIQLQSTVKYNPLIQTLKSGF